MADVIEPVGCRPFAVDPGRIDPAVLRLMAELLYRQLGPALTAHLREAAATVGMAGLWAALVEDGPPLSQLAQAVESAAMRCRLWPEVYRVRGSQICAAAFGIGTGPTASARQD